MPFVSPGSTIAETAATDSILLSLLAQSKPVSYKDCKKINVGDGKDVWHDVTLGRLGRHPHHDRETSSHLPIYTPRCSENLSLFGGLQTMPITLHDSNKQVIVSQA